MLTYDTQESWRMFLYTYLSTRYLTPTGTFLPCSSLAPPIDLVSNPHRLRIVTYCFRIVSASGSENDRRTIRDRYGINTRLIRERYENDTRTVFSDSQPKRLIRSLTFSSSFLLIIFYISITRRSLPFMTRSLASPFALAQPLYKDNLPPSRMQAD